MEDVGGKIKGSLQVGFIGVLSRFGMAGIPFRRPAMGMAFGKFFIHHFDDLGVDGALADEGPDDVRFFRKELGPFIEALLRMVRRRIGAQGGKEGDILMMEPFKEGLGFGISRPRSTQ